MIQFDSSYVIDLQDELAEERPGGAFELIESLDPGELLAVSVHVVAELRAGAERKNDPIAEHRKLDAFLEGFDQVESRPEELARGLPQKIDEE